MQRGTSSTLSTSLFSISASLLVSYAQLVDDDDTFYAQKTNNLITLILSVAPQPASMTLYAHHGASSSSTAQQYAPLSMGYAWDGDRTYSGPAYSSYLNTTANAIATPFSHYSQPKRAGNYEIYSKKLCDTSSIEIF